MAPSTWWMRTRMRRFRRQRTAPAIWCSSHASNRAIWPKRLRWRQSIMSCTCDPIYTRTNTRNGSTFVSQTHGQISRTGSYMGKSTDVTMTQHNSNSTRKYFGLSLLRLLSFSLSLIATQAIDCEFGEIRQLVQRRNAAIDVLSDRR